MKSVVFKILTASVALGAAVFALAGSAGATHLRVDMSVPEQPAIGQMSQVRAEFHSVAGGAPVAGMTVTFVRHATLAGVTGNTELGQAVTDENGVATLACEPRAAGTHEIHVQYATDGGDVEDTAASFTVPASGQQLYHSTAGVKIPGLNVNLLMAVVATVWLILLSVAIRVILIAGAGTEGESEEARVAAVSAATAGGR